MRFLSFSVLFFALLIVPLAGAGAQQANAPAASAGAAEENGKEKARPEPTVDELFDRLKREPNGVAARRIAQQIIEKFNDSGSATVNMLMGRAASAMASEKTELAQDMLTQVIVLAPDFAEGWNRRATLNYATGNIGESLYDIEQVLTIEPRHFGALSGLATILQSTGQDRKALEVWYRLLAVYPALSEAQQAVTELEDKLSGERS
jgi:tetratricopeptide (TPR) repeat protein